MMYQVLFVVFVISSSLGAEIVSHPSLKNARLVVLNDGDQQFTRRNNEDLVHSFLKENNVFALDDIHQVKPLTQIQTKLGRDIHIYEQHYQGVKVYGGEIKATVANGKLKTIAGTVLPGLKIDTKPSLDASEAHSIAIEATKQKLAKDPKNKQADPTVEKTELYIYNPSLKLGTEGPSHLTFVVTVNTQKSSYKVFVDAHNGQVIEFLDAHPSILQRYLYQNKYAVDSLIWEEGDSRPPLGRPILDRYLNSAEWIYKIYNNSWGRDSIDNNGLPFVSVDNGLEDLNAYWSQNITVFNSALIAVDVIVHEFQHGYTEFTGGLIYLYQPGALNEAYSDIVGNTVEILFDESKKTTNNIIRSNDCYERNVYPDTFTVTLESSKINITAIPADISPRLKGTYPFVVANICDPKNTETYDGAAILVDINEDCSLSTAFYAALSLNISAVFITSPDGPYSPIVPLAPFPIYVLVDNYHLLNVTSDMTIESLDITPPTTESTRWILSEDADITQPLRDMWNPVCAGYYPTSIDSQSYVCRGDYDNGGVHINSAVINKMYTSLVDGSVVDGITIEPIGLTKAFYIYTAAQLMYQDPFTSFGYHATGLMTACGDLVNITLPDLVTGQNSSLSISSEDCQVVETAIGAFKLNDKPFYCNVKTITPATQKCVNSTLYYTGFDNNLSGWTLGSDKNYGDDWVYIPSLPYRGWDKLAGVALAPNTLQGDCTTEDYSQYNSITSPTIINNEVDGNLDLEFFHVYATEPDYDGGLVMYSVDDGLTWSPVNDFYLNGYDVAIKNNSGNPYGNYMAFSGGFNAYEFVPVPMVSRATIPSNKGDKIKLRFIMASDICGGFFGWALDYVRLTTCSGQCIGKEDGDSCDLDGQACSVDQCRANTCVNVSNTCATTTAAGEELSEGNQWKSPVVLLFIATLLLLL